MQVLQQVDRAVALNAISELDRNGLLHLGARPPGSAPLVHVKDNIAVCGMHWTAGTPLFADVRADRDASAVRLLRDAGATIAFRTTLHELALGVTGANGWTGAIANPHDPDRFAGGSSGGAAAALALGIGDIAVVTDTGGSARIPAAFCGVYGFRPSTGRYPCDGLIALSPSRDTVGLMARELRWIRWADAIMANKPLSAVPAGRRWRIGIANDRDLGTLQPEIASAYRRFASLLAASGYQLMPVDLDHVFALDDACGLAIAMYETRASLEVSARALANATFADLLDAIATPEVAEMLAATGVSPEAYAQAVNHGWPALNRAFATLFADGIDLLCLPTTPVTAPTLTCGELVRVAGHDLPAFPTLTRYTRPDSMAGLPSINIPFGYDDHKLPIGMMLCAARRNDAGLLTFADSLTHLSGFPEPRFC